MLALILALLLLATPVYAQAPSAACEEQLTALTHAVNSLIEASRAAARAEARAKKAEDKLKSSTPKAPSKPEAPGQ